ncbi:hypothetical protein SERLADRAFT_407196 [Serpula lacrymans var. lacrymans S7.9]|uniref:Uncharacterized protein n=1 Tax=Serpula lacrymans var. lacrymans (strain S7.9) TaxID=578457 RepID=F8NS86_SERL9|nr:uncharacterized protein SERLADRAFT_407196 [Serpula lacrymans var. lacrymans S7.9]EGO26395.1 hypothetical protein SERLADRAFT_407196 [Serpula lacrymans var. lacrymans S7.9]
MAPKLFASSQAKLDQYIHSFTVFCRTQAFDLDSQSFNFERTHRRAESNCHVIESTSGPAQTNTELGSAVLTVPKLHVERKDTYICKGGVDARRLLSLTRQSLYLSAKNLGGTVLVDERIIYPKLEGKSRKPDQYKVKIHYFASVARSRWPDAKKPVRLEAVKGVRGLMTVLDRQ